VKLVVIGLGQCGGRIADEFARLNRRARVRRGVEIVSGSFAVNTNATELRKLSAIKADRQHRIVIGSEETKGHSTAMICEVGAGLARKYSDVIIEAVHSCGRLYEADALLLTASTAGGTGGGAMPVVAWLLKEYYPEKPVYILAVLPFDHEEKVEKRVVYNTALCLKSAYEAADAVILFDNQRYISKFYSVQNNMQKINEMITEPFYNLLCAGEEKKSRHVGAKVLDAVDIRETFSGWTAVGYGKTYLPQMKIPFERGRDFYRRNNATLRGIHAMDEALHELSVGCDTADACKALSLLSAPADEMSMELVKSLVNHLGSIAPRAEVREGVYPCEKGMMDVVVVLSGLSDVAKVRNYYIETVNNNDCHNRNGNEHLRTYCE